VGGIINIRMRVSYFTNKGRVRNTNEDALLISQKLISGKSLDNCMHESVNNGDFSLLVVADGLGGHKKGEVASKLVLETLKDYKPSNEDSLIKTLNIARERLEDYVKQNPEAYGLGCALAGLIIKDNKAIAFNVGDCRVYRIINEKLIKLTRDHSVVEELLLDGIITREEARNHPKKNILTSAIIGDGYKTELKVFTTNVDMSIGGRFLICSDGLWSEFEENEIKTLLLSKNPCEEFVETLFENKSIQDNVSFIILL